MPAKSSGTMPTQADKRRNMVMTDQVGRKYFAVIEKASGFPTGLVQPLYEAPHPDLYPPQKYMTFPEDQPGKLIIDFPTWEADLDVALKAWDNERVRVGAMIHGAAFDPHGPPTVQLVQLIGPKPMSPLPVRAMRQGNRWALGFTKIKPPEAERFFPTPTEDPNADIFSETEPVFPEPIELGQTSEGGVSLQTLLADVMQRCPPNYRGAARRSWAMQELERMAETQEA